MDGAVKLMIPALALSSQGVVILSPQLVKGGGGILCPRFYEVYGDNFTYATNPLASFDFSRFDYSALIGSNHSSIRVLLGLSQPDFPFGGVGDATTYGLGPVGMLADGSWLDTGGIDWPLWVWANADYQKAWDDGTYPQQLQIKARIVGPAKGTLLTYPTYTANAVIPGGNFGLVGGGIGPNIFDPLTFALMRPNTMVRKELGLGETLDLNPALPDTITRGANGPATSNLVCFRFGKQPNDFGGYITSISPATLPANDDYSLQIAGVGLAAGFTLTIGGWDVTGISTLASSVLITVAWEAFTLGSGTYDVVYTPASGPASTLTGAFTIT